MNKPKNMTQEEEAARREKNRERCRRNYLNKKQEYIERAREWKKRNPEKREEIVRKWQKLNPEKRRAKQRKWQSANREKVRENRKKWRSENPQLHRKCVQNWKNKNPGKLRDDRKKMPVWYIANNLRIPAETLRQYPDLLESQREVIRFKREIRNRKTA